MYGMHSVVLHVKIIDMHGIHPVYSMIESGNHMYLYSYLYI